MASLDEQESQPNTVAALLDLAKSKAFLRPSPLRISESIYDIGQEAIPALLAAMDDPADSVREVATRSLGLLQVVTAIPVIARALTDQSPRVRRSAAYALAEIGPAAAPVIPALSQAIEHDEALMQSAAVYALEHIGEEAIPALGEALNHRSLDVRVSAAEALTRIGTAAIPSLISAFGDTLDEKVGVRFRRDHLFKALMKIGPASIPALITAVSEAKDEIRANAILALENFGPAAALAVPALSTALLDQDVRFAAAQALVTIDPTGTPAAVLVLSKYLSDRDPYIRTNTAGKLKAIGPAAASAVPALAVLLADQIGWVREGAAYALAAIGPAAAPAIPVLVKSLADDSTGAREGAALALGKIGPVAASAVPALTNVALNDRQISVRLGAVAALGAIGPATGSAARALFKSLENQPNTVIEAVVKAVASMGAVAIPTLVVALRHRDVVRRRAAAQALAVMGTDKALDAIPVLSKDLHDVNGNLWRDAAAALVAIGPPAIPTLLSALRSERALINENAALALGRLGSAAIPSLVGILGEPNRALRLLGVYALSAIGPDAAPTLVKALTHQDEEVRGAAARALKGMGADALPALLTVFRQHDQTAYDAANRLVKSSNWPSQTIIDTFSVLALDLNESPMVRGRAIALIQHFDPEAAEAITAATLAESRQEMPPEGIELMGDRALAIREPLKRFRLIGEDCKRRKSSDFKFLHMGNLCGESDGNARIHISKVSQLFHDYFHEFEGIQLVADNDESTDGRDKLFDRVQGKRGTTICPRGWQAWELTCRFLDRLAEREAASRQPR